MWKPRNKWQLQTKGGCESSEGGSSSDSRIVIRGTVNQDGTYKFEPIEPNLVGYKLVLADVIVIDDAAATASRGPVSQCRFDDAGYYLLTTKLSKSSLIYDPSTGAVSEDSSSGGIK